MTSRPFGLTLRLCTSLDMGLRISIKRGAGRVRKRKSFLFFSTRKRQRTESVLLVLAARTKSETAIVLTHAPVDAVAEALVEVNRDRVCAANVEIDEEAAVDVVRRRLEEVHKDAREGETPVFGRDRQGGDVAVEVMRRPFCLAQDCNAMNMKPRLARDEMR